MNEIVVPTAQVGLSGFYKMEAVRPDGRRRLLADWFPNLITDYGINAIGNQSNYFRYCHVGSGNTAPLVTDTQLENFVGVTGTTTAAVSIASGTPPYYGGRRNTYRFAAGAAAGNLSEVGVGPFNNNTNLFSRALILDAQQSPTTITVLGDEILDVTYEIRLYVPTEDVVGTFDVSGVTYNYTLRAANATNGSSIGGWGLNTFGSNGGIQIYVYSNAYGANATLNAITGNLGGTSAGTGNSSSSAAYIDSSFYRDGTFNWGVDNGNSAGTGVGGIRLVCGLGAFQIAWTPAIPKNNTKTMSLTFRNSWGRYTP